MEPVQRDNPRPCAKATAQVIEQSWIPRALAAWQQACKCFDWPPQSKHRFPQGKRSCFQEGRCCFQVVAATFDLSPLQENALERGTGVKRCKKDRRLLAVMCQLNSPRRARSPKRVANVPPAQGPNRVLPRQRHSCLFVSAQDDNVQKSSCSLLRHLKGQVDVGQDHCQNLQDQRLSHYLHCCIASIRKAEIEILHPYSLVNWKAPCAILACGLLLPTLASWIRWGEKEGRTLKTRGRTRPRGEILGKV
mmetsp:Transcript_17544/g.36625  ORF Transcript_17544/g.36625 Transcript_17544/m.36625 type:complete len:249 (-) Transcript_17544:390-1136(-)